MRYVEVAYARCTLYKFTPIVFSAAIFSSSTPHEAQSYFILLLMESYLLTMVLYFDPLSALECIISLIYSR